MPISGGAGRTFNKSGKKSMTITSGANNSAVLDLGRNYAFVIIGISDCTGFATGAELSLQVGPDSSAALYDVYTPNDPSTKWSKVMPLTGSVFFRVDGLDFARFLKFFVSINTDAALTVDVWGYDGSA